jgi:chemotaxis protein methyltransferase CheR
MRRERHDQLELRLLLEGVYLASGYDFRDYADTSLRRRVATWLAEVSLESPAAAIGPVLRDPRLLDSLVRSLPVTVSEMFRDPPCFRALREQVLPLLETYPHVRIWQAGCGAGEEVYSLAILLQERGLAGRYRIYATDINEAALQRAREGVYPLKDFAQHEARYRAAGGRGALGDYFTSRYERARLAPALRKDVLFSTHNLAVDGPFTEAQLAVCRNVLIYFKPALKDRALALLDEALVPGGFLCLGKDETLVGRAIEPGYEPLPGRVGIWRKRYPARRGSVQGRKGGAP